MRRICLLSITVVSVHMSFFLKSTRNTCLKKCGMKSRDNSKSAFWQTLDFWRISFTCVQIRNVVKTKNYYTELFGVPTHQREYLSAPYQMSKAKSTLHQLIRDWSDEVIMSMIID